MAECVNDRDDFSGAFRCHVFSAGQEAAERKEGGGSSGSKIGCHNPIFNGVISVIEQTWDLYMYCSCFKNCPSEITDYCTNRHDLRVVTLALCLTCHTQIGESTAIYQPVQEAKEKAAAAKAAKASKVGWGDLLDGAKDW